MPGQCACCSRLLLPVITFAGNRDELVEVIGRAVVDGWESGMGQHLGESGPGDNGDDAYDFWKDCA